MFEGLLMEAGCGRNARISRGRVKRVKPTCPSLRTIASQPCLSADLSLARGHFGHLKAMSGWQDPGLKHCLCLPGPSRREMSKQMTRNNLDLPDTLHEIKKEERASGLCPRWKVVGGEGRTVSHQKDRQTPGWLAGPHH